MSSTVVSVVVPTHNRPQILADTLESLRDQTGAPHQYEIIVVDDGSDPPVTVPEPVRLIRLEGEERSAARNAGASAASGELLIFIDDDIKVSTDFVEKHLSAHREWPDALLVGAIRLPEETRSTPFGQFRQRLEDRGIPQERGLTSKPNICTAANMSIPRVRFQELGGFDPSITSGEDQDLALRHAGNGGRIAFIPEASVTHMDNALDLRSYCRRAEWGSRMIGPFCERYPDLPDNVIRREVNLPFNAVKSLLSTRPFSWLLFHAAAVLERVAPDSEALERLYRALLGIHIYRGFRHGIR